MRHSCRRSGIRSCGTPAASRDRGCAASSRAPPRRPANSHAVRPISSSSARPKTARESPTIEVMRNRSSVSHRRSDATSAKSRKRPLLLLSDCSAFLRVSISCCAAWNRLAFSMAIEACEAMPSMIRSARSLKAPACGGRRTARQSRSRARQQRYSKIAPNGAVASLRASLRHCSGEFRVRRNVIPAENTLAFDDRTDDAFLARQRKRFEGLPVDAESA